ncbi:PGAP1-domain-containing protein [Backusella circina FSU 941]|nr:PGAP1-domain-containing protein [Backusella circina FSU 941]
MTWSRPSYIEIQDKPDSPLSKKYTLYLYREGYLDSDELQGIPTLFIPGQAGSYKQVRSLAAETAAYYHNNQHQSSTRTLDYFTVDLNEELSALNGHTILEQADYMNAVIQSILQLYKNTPQNPNSVLIIGHSMGGLVARSMFMSPSYISGSINTIITLASPHLNAPLLLDPVIYKTYKKLTEFWTPDRFHNDPLLRDVSITSITGGFLDTIVDSNGARLESFVPATHGFSAVSSSIPFVWTGCDHMAILWCNQLVKVVAKSLVEITDISTSAQTRPLLDRIRVFKQYLVNGLELGSNAFITNIPVHLDHRWSIVICTQGMDCKTVMSDINILPSATAEKPIMADPYRLVTLKESYLKDSEYIGIIDNGGPTIPSGFIVSDNYTNVVEHNVGTWGKCSYKRYDISN